MPTLPILAIMVEHAERGTHSVHPAYTIHFRFADNATATDKELGIRDLEQLANMLDDSEWATFGNAIQKLGNWANV
jgi:hypothetical protein